MQYTTLITHMPDTSWRAAVPALPDCMVEANTRHEAVARIKERIREVVARTEILQLNVPIEPARVLDDSSERSTQPPWDLVSLFKNDPTWDELFDNIEAERDANLLEPIINN